MYHSPGGAAHLPPEGREVEDGEAVPLVPSPVAPEHDHPLPSDARAVAPPGRHRILGREGFGSVQGLGCPGARSVKRGGELFQNSE